MTGCDGVGIVVWIAVVLSWLKRYVIPWDPTANWPDPDDPYPKRHTRGVNGRSRKRRRSRKSRDGPRS